MRYLVTLFVFFNIIFTTKAHNELGFSTTFIRDTWYVCFKTSQAKMPLTNVNVHVMFCDCVIDKGRAFFGNQDNINSYSDNSTKVWSGFANDCGYEIQMTLNPNGFNL